MKNIVVALFILEKIRWTVKKTSSSSSHSQSTNLLSVIFGIILSKFWVIKNYDWLIIYTYILKLFLSTFFFIKYYVTFLKWVKFVVLSRLLHTSLKTFYCKRCFLLKMFISFQQLFFLLINNPQILLFLKVLLYIIYFHNLLLTI